MSAKLKFDLVQHGQHSDYDWLNIDCGSVRVGKARGIIDGKKLTIYSINVFPEFEGCGYAKQTIDMFKQSFDIIIADRVRHTAIGFWMKMGFIDVTDGNYKYEKNGAVP